jgi:hypothetical protein
MDLRFERHGRAIQSFAILAQSARNAVDLSREAPELFVSAREHALEALRQLGSPGVLRERTLPFETAQGPCASLPLRAHTEHLFLHCHEIFAARLEASTRDGELTALPQQSIQARPTNAYEVSV